MLDGEEEGQYVSFSDQFPPAGTDSSNTSAPKQPDLFSFVPANWSSGATSTDSGEGVDISNRVSEGGPGVHSQFLNENVDEEVTIPANDEEKEAAGWILPNKEDDDKGKDKEGTGQDTEEGAESSTKVRCKIYFWSS